MHGTHNVKLILPLQMIITGYWPCMVLTNMTFRFIQSLLSTYTYQCVDNLGVSPLHGSENYISPVLDITEVSACVMCCDRQ